MKCRLKTQARRQKKTTFITDKVKTLVKDAFLFGMSLVFFEIQFDFNASVTKPTGLRAPVINSIIGTRIACRHLGILTSRPRSIPS